MDDKMSNAQQLIETIEKKCIEYGISFDNITPSTKKHFINFESYYSNVIEEATKASKILKGNNLNFQAISKELNVSRQALYNHPVLIQYITNRTEEFKDRHNTCPAICEEYQNLKLEFEAYKNREVEYLQQQEVIRRLEQKVEALTTGKAYTDLKKENEELKKQITALEELIENSAEAEYDTISINCNRFMN